ncbi:hypothetical protein [Methanoregula sp.]|uniref:hypothetical protein n=1 Tax=Methanoregula sp. TaxID=2052170 RepID=UPI0023741B8D|nr:hypothetical protein [Methanoregula sp.]MDD1685486.1 hypothetical protein [Methanoregula sp.]
MRFKQFLVLLFLISLIGTASAFQPSSGALPTSENITSGSPVTYKAVIDFPPRGSEGTFPADHNLVFTTRLENPLWTYALILDGFRNPDKTVTAEQLTLSGFELNYPANVQQSVVVIVNGTAPEVSRVTMTSIMDTSERDDAGKIIPNTSRSDSQIPIYPRVTTTPAPVPTTIPTTQKGSPAPIVIFCGIASACGIVHIIGKRQSASSRE